MNIKKTTALSAAIVTLACSGTGQAMAQGSGSADLTGSLDSMIDVFETADDPTGLGGFLGGDVDTGSIDSLVGSASELDVSQYADTMETVLIEAGIDEETASIAANSTTSMTSALVGAASAEEMAIVLEGAPACATAMAALATSAAGASAGAAGVAGAPITGGASLLATGAGGLTSATAATAAIPGLLGCTKVAGAALKVGGNAVSAYENDPDAPQLVEFASMLDPDSGIGADVIDAMPEDQQDSAAQAMSLSASVAVPLSKMQFGSTLIAYGDAVMGLGDGNPAALTAVVPASLQLGTQVVSAVGEIAGMDVGPLEQVTNMNIPGMEELESTVDSDLNDGDVDSITSSVSSGSRSERDDDLDEDTTRDSDSGSSSSGSSTINRTTVGSGSSSDVDEDASEED